MVPYVPENLLELFENYHVNAQYFDANQTETYDKNAIALEFDIDLREINDRQDWDILFQQLLTSDEKKRKGEVNVRRLTEREKLGFRAAKRKEFAQWIDNKVIDILVAKGVPRDRIIRW